MNPQAVAFVKALNERIHLLVQERDRVIQLMSETLPGGITVWSLLSPEIKTAIKANMRENLVTVQTNLTTLIELFDEVPTAAAADAAGESAETL